MWPEIEAELHDQLKRVLVGHFHVDPGLANHEEIIERVQPMIDKRDREEERELIEKIMGGALSEQLGAIGLDRVMDALEKGEVRTLAWTSSRNGGASATSEGTSSCSNCGHLERGKAQKCELCSSEMRWFARDEEVLVRHALGRNLEVRTLRYGKLPPPDEIGAWLRFRANQNTGQALAS